MTFVMPSGVLVDTSASDAEAAFERAEPDLAIGLLELRGQLLADRELVDRVRRKYAIRNTHGYRLCALLDGETPLEIFRRLLVASEGSRPLSLPRAKRLAQFGRHFAFVPSADMHAPQESGLKKQAFNGLLFRPRDSTPRYQNPRRGLSHCVRCAPVECRWPHWPQRSRWVST